LGRVADRDIAENMYAYLACFKLIKQDWKRLEKTGNDDMNPVSERDVVLSYM